jgi:type IV pilus assembly protein PilM
MIDLKSFFKKEYVIGLDIGSSSVKVAQFAETEGALRLVKADLKELPHTDDDAAREHETISAVKYLLRGVDLKKSTIIASVNCPQTAVKKLTAPYMPRSELRDGVRLQAKNYFPFPIDDALVDYEILGDVVDKGVRKYELIVATCPIKTVDRYLELLKKAGIRPSIFVSTSAALQKIAELPPDKKGRTVCLVDIGESHTELVVVNGGYLSFSRKVPIAGSDFTKAMTGMLVSDRGKTQLSIDEAEKIKKEVGLPQEGDSRVIDNKITSVQILSMLRSPVEQLAGEIERCFDFYREESGGGNIDSVILFGGGASLGGLIKLLSDSLGVEVKLGDPLEGLKMDKSAAGEREKTAHRLELAVGAALSGTKGINLLPPEIKEERQMVVKRGTAEAITTAIVIVSILLYIGMRIKVDNLKTRIAVAKKECSSLQPQLKKSEALILAKSVLADEPQWEDVFKELSNIIPESIHIESMRMENNIITMSGVVAGADDEQALAAFILTLERGIFSNVKLVSSKDLADTPGVAFELKCWVDYEGA